jgi:hypothetical protein
LERFDLGIAMCHFALAAGEAGLGGIWQVSQPAVDLADMPVAGAADGRAEYIVT